MMIKKTLLPGDPGTKAVTEKFGEKLICIRYRYDPEKQMRLKTAEIILEAKVWKPDKKRIPGNKLIKIRVGKFETTVQTLVQSYGGKRTDQTNTWLLPYCTIKKLNLQKRIIK